MQQIGIGVFAIQLTHLSFFVTIIWYSETFFKTIALASPCHTRKGYRLYLILLAFLAVWRGGKFGKWGLEIENMVKNNKNVKK